MVSFAGIILSLCLRDHARQGESECLEHPVGYFSKLPDSPSTAASPELDKGLGFRRYFGRRHPGLRKDLLPDFLFDPLETESTRYGGRCEHTSRRPCGRLWPGGASLIL